MARPRTPLSSHGTISVSQMRAGQWRARTRHRFEDGKLRQVERFAPTKAKAQARLREALTTIRATAGVEITRTTRLQDLGRRFLQSKTNLAPRSQETYSRALNKVITPLIGDLAVFEATPERLQRFLDYVSAEVGLGTARTCRAVLSGMLGLATRSDAIEHNPVRELSLAAARPQGATAIPIPELGNVLRTVQHDERLVELDVVDLVVFMAGTGVRISEASALAWTNVELEQKTVTICANAVRVTGVGVIIQPHTKSDAGVRRIRIPDSVVDMLRSRAGRDTEPHGLVFPTVRGLTRDPRNTARDWRNACVRLGLPLYSFHSFRKTVATTLDQAGLSPRDVAEYLGHSDPSLTMGTYMSKTVGGRRAADALDSVLA